MLLRLRQSSSPLNPSSSLALFSFVIYRRDIREVTYLQNEKEQEVGVGNFLELLKEVDRQEGENIVLGGLDAVTLWQQAENNEAPAPQPRAGAASAISVLPKPSALSPQPCQQPHVWDREEEDGRKSSQDNVFVL